MDAIMPGAWVCDKCGFTLQKNILHTGDGAVTADTSPLNEQCPNDGVLMRPLTWREANEQLFKRASDLLHENTALRDAVRFALDLANYREATCSGSPRKPRPNWAEGCGPDWRIVTNGRRYRVQQRIQKAKPGSGEVDHWENVGDRLLGGWSNEVSVKLFMDEQVGHFVPFETRWLWRAKRRMRRESEAAMAAEAAKRPELWSVVV